MTPMTQWMIYGANGYTGELIVAEAKRLGLLTKRPELMADYQRKAAQCRALGGTAP